MWTGLFFGLFFDRFLDPFLDHWGSTPLVLREGIMFVSKKTRRQIGHHVCLRDVMSLTHPIYACAGNNHARHLISSQCILLQLEARDFKVTLCNLYSLRKQSHKQQLQRNVSQNQCKSMEYFNFLKTFQFILWRKTQEIRQMKIRSLKALHAKWTACMTRISFDVSGEM